MGETTKIQWTHHTFNPWIGCTKVHLGCKFCYAEKLATTRLGRNWGPGAERRVTSAANWKQPLRWARAAAKAGERRRVFCASLADVLDEEAPKVAQAALWETIRETADLRHGADEDLPVGGLDWLILTKRPERWSLIPADVRAKAWGGTSISDQETADIWVPRLLEAEGFAVRFLSVEPQVGPIDLSDWLRREVHVTDDVEDAPDGVVVAGMERVGATWIRRTGIDWVIVGGESGPGARPFDVAWARSVVEQCRAAGVPVFVKQLGAVVHETVPSMMGAMGDHLMERRLKDKKGGDPSEWPADLRVREFPEVRP